MPGEGAPDEMAMESFSSSEGVTRIYIGGLGGGVKDSDVLNLFAPLGRVSGIDFVRTKGRAFGYMDFAPTSDKSLAKLFSTYNGCMWKGGRLRIEKAKEHYLERLKREWAEHTEPLEQPASDDTLKDLRLSIRSKNEDINMVQLHIFFPKLRKVKALPFKGTGKHKYSFQRVVTASSLPRHFCDCEEHSRLSEDLVGKRLDDHRSIVDDEERNIINCVMNKLLGKDEARRSTVLSTAEMEDGHNGECPEDPPTTQQEEDAEEDEEDNLVTNILGPKDVDEEMSKLMQPKPQESKNVGKRRAVISKRDQQKAREDRLSSPEKKMKRSLIEAPRPESLPDAEDFNAPLQTEDRETKPRNDPTKGGAPSWIQKSSWRELVGDAGGTTRNSAIFTISQVLSGTEVSAVRSRISAEALSSPPSSDRGEAKAEERKRYEEKKAAVPFCSAPVRSFVRSRDSDKDWAKAKAALSGLLKRSRSNKPHAAEETA